jgi:signal transduction histidine kinase
LTPLPSRQFQGFISVFHVIFVAGLGLCLFMRFRRPGFTWDLSDTALVGLVLVQAALYVWFLILQRVPQTAGVAWAGYFASGYVIWLLEWQLEPALQWTAWAYLGQMFGVLPPRFSAPASVAVFLTYFGLKLGWANFVALKAWDWFSGIFLLVSVTALGMFLHRITVTSSERARLIQELERARKELELSRHRDTELAALRERERLARDLHDSLGHSLVTLTVQLEAAQRLYAVDPSRGQVVLEEMKSLTRTSMEQLRRSLAGLRAPGLGERPLSEAIRDLCAEVRQRTSLDLDCHLADRIENLPPAVAEVLWRVVQEGLANIEKHAAAKKASVRLEWLSTAEGANRESRKIRAQVGDDGVGLPADAEARPGHYGLRGLRERVEGVGGEFALTANGSKGGLLQAQIPILT